MKATSYTMRRLATDDAARRAAVDAARAMPNGELANVERTIKAYEEQYKMSSAEALAAVSNGTLRPTTEIERWVMAVRVRDDLAQLKASARR